MLYNVMILFMSVLCVVKNADLWICAYLLFTTIIILFLFSFFPINSTRKWLKSYGKVMIVLALKVS